MSSVMQSPHSASLKPRLESFSIIVALETKTEVVVLLLLVGQHSVLDRFGSQVEEILDEVAMKGALQRRFYLCVFVQGVLHTDVHIGKVNFVSYLVGASAGSRLDESMERAAGF